MVRRSDVEYLTIVAPRAARVGIEQTGREARVTPTPWSVYDTTDSCAVSNPVRVERLMVMSPTAECCVASEC